MNHYISLVIADDHEIFRDGLAMMLAKQPKITLEGQAEDGKELIELVKTKNPDIVLADIKMPRMDGIEATKFLTAHFPDVRIIALSMFDEEELIVEMLEAGAKGYLLKNADKQEIIEAITCVYQDNIFYCRQTSARLAAMIVKSRFNPSKEAVPVFTERETEIIRL